MGGSRGRLISKVEKELAIKLIRKAHSSGARKYKACEMLGISMRTYERWVKEGLQDKRKGAWKKVGNRITKEERKLILKTANDSEYRDLPPSKIVPLLADIGIYIASESTIYRILREENQLKHRGLTKPRKHKKPEPYTATGANQLWSWDISYLPTQVKGMYYYLYIIMDVYSRKIVGWTVHENQSADHAANLIQQTCLDEAIDKNEVVLHSDNGTPMKGATMLAMLEKLGVTPSFSRPSVSDDNPFSEALFKTLKYHPSFPLTDKFATIEGAREWTIKFADWYNNKHLHSGIKFVTPNQRHTGADIRILGYRNTVYLEARNKRPERWSGNTRNWGIQKTVSLNPGKKNNQKCSNDEIQIKEAI